MVGTFYYILRAFTMVEEFQLLIDSPCVINFRSTSSQLVEPTGHYLNSLES